MWYRAGRSYARLGIDLIWVALSAYAALIIRDNFDPSVSRLQALSPYVILCVLSAAIVFSAAGLHRTVWRYVSLGDVLRLIAAVTVTLLAALLGGFIFNRLEEVARSVPVIQWFLLICAMVGFRIAIRLWGERRARTPRPLNDSPAEHVLIIGLDDLTELYLRSVSEFAAGSIVVLGILSPGPELRGRIVRRYKILGRPKDLPQVLSKLELHGVRVDRVIVTQPFEKLSRSTQDALRELERSSSVKVDWLIEILGLNNKDRGVATPIKSQEVEPPKQYHRLKRVIDAAIAILLIVALAPVMMIVALLVAMDVGLPLVFWQQRPGRYGRPFKLFKFRTMREAHDADGNRIPDEARSSAISRFLRRSWLDELPQLYNILVGEMSFVGPRPLLVVDQPKLPASRLLVRPGLTGWAQINGGRDISPEDKAALDMWYISNASLWLDIKILLWTFDAMVSGGRLTKLGLQAQHASIAGTNAKMSES